jgi:hypothetical protein
LGGRAAGGDAVTASRKELRLVAPEEPPRLTPGAAEALLKILLEARCRRDVDKHGTERDDER